ncbi:MAG: hypothetical protein ACLQVW_05525 [Limisphaerales bacterium]
MIKQMETSSLEQKVRLAAKHRRIHHRLAVRMKLEAYSSAAGGGPREEPQKRFDSQMVEARPAPPRSHMRVLLRHAKTHKYLQSGEHWTKNPKQARDFRNGWWAAIYAFTMNPRHLVIQYEFDDDRYNLNIPVLGHART